jgi:hypothetical protein
MAYYIFKRFSEVDPAKAHAKLTHQRLATPPNPKGAFADADQRTLHDSIVINVSRLLGGAPTRGGEEDREVEQALRHLWGITADEGAYINRECYDLPDSQVIRDLFPDGRPRPQTIVVS